MKITPTLNTLMLGCLLLAGAAGCKKSGGGGVIDGKWAGSDLSNPGAQCQLTIGNGSLEFHGTNENDSFTGTIALIYSETQPGTVDVNITQPASLAGQTLRFIFERKGSELKLAWTPPGTYSRPSDFTPAPGVRVVSLKRQ